MRPSGHWPGGVLSSFKITKSPISTFLRLRFHFDRAFSWVRYSSRHLLQKCWNKLVVICHLDKEDIFKWLKSGSGVSVSGCPIRKCDGVRASMVSSWSVHNGREFNNASIWVRIVWSSSYDRIWFPMTRFRWYFTALTAASQSPLKWGEAGGTKCHLVELVAASWWYLIGWFETSWLLGSISFH